MAQARFSRGDIRDILTEAGIAEENMETAVTKIVRKHLDVIEPLKSENDTISGKDKTIEKLKAQLETAETELETLKKEDYKSKLEALTADKEKLQKEYDDYKNEQTAKATKAAKEKAVSDFFKSKGNISDKNLNVIMRGSRDEIDAIELDSKGNIKDTKALEALAKDIYADMYTVTTTQGVVTPTPPETSGGKAVKSKADIMKITDAAERQAAIKEAIQNGSTEFGS